MPDVRPPASPRLDVLAVAAGILMIGAVDLATGVAFGVFVFYYLPVAYAGWRLGPRGALAASVASAAVWLAADIVGHVAPNPVGVVAWNSTIRLVAFLSIGWATARLQAALTREQQVSAELADALEEVRVLRGLLPVCAWCKNVRDEEGRWQSLEAYLAHHTDAEVTHGMCDDCARGLLDQATAPQAQR